MPSEFDVTSKCEGTSILWVLLASLATAVSGCGTAGKASAQESLPTNSALDGGASDDGTAATPAGVAMELGNLLPDGQCRPQGAILSVTLDGASLDGMSWKAEDLRTPGEVESGSAFASSAGQVGFRLSFLFASASVGTASPGALGASLQYGADPDLSCAAAGLTGAVRITRVNNDAGMDGAEVCGIYDLTCADAASGHTLHVRCTFDSVVQTSAGPGGP
jgi:hypothetical protein